MNVVGFASVLAFMGFLRGMDECIDQRNVYLYPNIGSASSLRTVADVVVSGQAARIVAEEDESGIRALYSVYGGHTHGDMAFTVDNKKSARGFILRSVFICTLLTITTAAGMVVADTYDHSSRPLGAGAFWASVGPCHAGSAVRVTCAVTAALYAVHACTYVYAHVHHLTAVILGTVVVFVACMFAIAAMQPSRARQRALVMPPRFIHGSSDEAGGACSICLECPEFGSVCRRLPCGHEFHAECIEKWVAVTARCPNCCADVPSALA